LLSRAQRVQASWMKAPRLGWLKGGSSGAIPTSRYTATQGRGVAANGCCMIGEDVKRTIVLFCLKRGWTVEKNVR